MQEQKHGGEPQVTWDAPDEGQWTAETAHNLGVTSVPMRDIMERTFAAGFRSTFAPLGVPLSHAEARHINGWPYVSFFVHDVPRKAGSPPPDFVLKLITRLHPGFRKRTKIAAAAIKEKRALGYATEWFGERESWVARVLDVQEGDMNAMTNAELADYLGLVSELAEDGMRRHFELIGGCIPVGHWLRRSQEWGVSDSEARRVVMHSTPVHGEAWSRLQRVADTLGEADPPTSFESIRTHSPEAAAALSDYIKHHGWWATEDKFNTTRMIDHPEAILRSINSHRSEKPRPDDASVLRGRLRSQVSAEDRDEFDRMVDEAHRAHTMLDDNSGILASWITGVAAHTLTHVGSRLERADLIDSVDHVHALTLEELRYLLLNQSALSASDVTERFEDWEALGRLTPPLHINGEPSPPPDPSVFPAPVAQLVGDIAAFLDDKFNENHRTSGIGNRTVTGRAVVTTHASDALARLEDGDILVTVSTTPAYNNILPFAGGLVVSEGGPSCHAAIVARELDLPTIVGFPDATTTIPDGAIIELDPVSATVRIATPAPA